MNVLEFRKLNTITQKKNELSRLSQAQKELLSREQNSSINNKWDSCKVESNLKCSKPFADLDDKILHQDNILSFTDWTYSKQNYGERKQKSIFQWDIFYCDLGHNIGSEKNKTRPVIIVQRTIGFLDADTIMIAPITIGENFEKLYKHEIVIDKTLRSRVKGKIDLSHIRSVDRSRLDEKFTDRLLSETEYKALHKDIPFIMTHTKINDALKSIFYIDGK